MIAREVVARTMSVVVYELLWQSHCTRRGILFVLDSEQRAGLLKTARAVTYLDCVLQKIWVPRGNEVAMVAIACGITIRKYKSAWVISELLHVEDGFVEQNWHTHWESRGTSASLNEFRKLHVGLVVR